MKHAPIILFVYNRPWHTQQTVEALLKNDLASESELFIYADGEKQENDPKVQEVRTYLKTIQGFKSISIIERNKNWGLANNVIDGVTEIVNKFEKIIVLEDDLVTSSGFLQYMNDALEQYKEEDKVMQISAHQFPVEKWTRNNEAFFLPFTTSWGWGTWKKAWKYFDSNAIGYEKLEKDAILKNKFDLQGSYPYTTMLQTQMREKTINSWAIKWWWSVFNIKGITLFPDFPLVENIGFGDDSTHTKTSLYSCSLFQKDYTIIKFPKVIKYDCIKYDYICNYLKSISNKQKVSTFTRLMNKVKSILKS